MNPQSLDVLCGALAYAMGIEPPAHAAPGSKELMDYVDEKLGGKKADRILMYNPDAIGQWVMEKYPQLLQEVFDMTELSLPMRSPMKSVTPVCFGTMYTGAQPEVHGIRVYEKPVIRIDSLFDALIRQGKKVAIVAQATCSMGKIFLERDMDYYFAPTSPEINAIGARLIQEDKYDFLVVYNGNFDSRMHYFGCESVETLSELRCNSSTFATLSHLVRRHWSQHNTLVGFAMDHGCHDIEPTVSKKDGKVRRGSHGDEIPEDLNICHRYMVYPAAE